MINLPGFVLLSSAVVFGGLSSRLLVDYPGPIAVRLGVHPWDLGRLLVGFHLVVTLGFLVLYVTGTFVFGSPSLGGYWPLVDALSSIAIYVMIFTAILAGTGIYLDRAIPRNADRWRPGRAYYLIALPMLVNVLLFGVDYLVQHRRYEGSQT